MPRASEVLQNWEWNEALPEGLGTWDHTLVSLVAIGEDGSPKLIGTAFIVASHGNYAVAVTAAHNFHEGVRQAQKPTNPWHNPSALSEFLPGAEEIKLDRTRMRAVYRVGDRVEACVLGFAAWDKRADIAVFTLAPQDTADDTVFRWFHRLGHIQPKVGDLVGVAGYGDMETLSDEGSGNEQRYTLARRIVFRAGRVKALHMEGHILCRGPCIETTIPVFGGMSGGPAFHVPENYGEDIIPFGLICHDPEEPREAKNDRRRAGFSIVGLLPLEVISDIDAKRTVQFTLENMGLAKNPEFDKPTANPESA